MARDSDQLAGSFVIENTGGAMSGLLAEEDAFDRRALWRIGSWGAAALGSVVLAVLANQSQLSLRHEQVAAADLTRQAQQLQSFAKESTHETRRLAAAVEREQRPRPAVFARDGPGTGADSATGAIARQNATAAQPEAAASPPPVASSTPAEPKTVAQMPALAASPAGPPPVVAPVATTMAMLAPKPVDAPPQLAAGPEQAPAKVGTIAPKAAEPPPPPAPAPLVAAKSIMAPPDPAAAKLIEPEKPAKAINSAPISDVAAAAPPADKAREDIASAAALPQAAIASVAVQRTEFGVDVGGANSVPGLRALWRGLLKSRLNAALTALRPIIVIREGINGLGMQLRLVAGPLSDAAAAAKICAGLMENDRPCETAVFDGQRLAMKADEPSAAELRTGTIKPTSPIKSATEAKPATRRHISPRRATSEEPAKKPDTVSTLSSFFGGGKR